MQNFAEQCLDMAQAILSHNLDAINEDGTIRPIEGEHSRTDEPGHAALAIGEYFRLTNESKFGDHDLVDLVARTVTAQTFTDEEAENGLAYAALGLLSFSPAKERNPVWERLLEQTQETFDKRLLQRSDYDNHLQSFNIAKAVTRFSMGLSKKDETGKLVDRFIERIKENSSTGYMDDEPTGLGGSFDIYGILSFVFIRQALQLHSNMHLRDRKLPSLRTHAEKYLKMLPDVVRLDGMGWCYGRGIGAYGQMHCISLILQALRDGWITDTDKPKYVDLMRRLFQFFFLTYVDREHGFLVIRDDERTTGDNHTTRMANFDAARYLCQWARLARSIGGTMDAKPAPVKRVSRFVVFDKSHKKEQGLFMYHDPDSGLHVQIPLISQGRERFSDSLAFPHCPGVVDWPVAKYLPILLPELTFGDKIVIPAFYGKRCTIRQGLRNALTFSYEQPDLITTDEKYVSGLGSCKVTWTFLGGKMTSEFVFTVKQQVTMDSMRYLIALGTPHSTYRHGMSFTLGAEGLRPAVVKDDFHAEWDTQSVTADSDYKTYWGKLHFLQSLKRDHPLIMRPGQQYRLMVEFEPDLAMADE
ncbi:hypothetical protein [Cerasicoccus arenae]|uniref:Uncharacterized protein n=1 Tax=Cerasicoccus arenae TaxID=424488 RepID=A0A8J3DEC7_9BACT|nr:hypothetical protein [Cerasicoccus arenae]MBK1857386.1 hypothetical protein [Cerasicoccus arenae]GHC09173.1 hypothetical protein GCM10007047_28070 [Cerasicoccus arenae]